MTEAAPTTETTTPAAPAPKGDSPGLVDGVRAVFGDEAAEAIGGKPLVTQTEPAKDKAAPAETEKPAVDERVSKRILAAQRAEMRAAQQRREIEDQRKALEAERAAVKELAQLAEQAKAAKMSPSKLLELSGLSPKEFLETLATEHEPDKVAERATQGVKSELDKLREEVETLRKEREAEAQRAEQAKVEAAIRENEQQFVNLVLEKGDGLPHLQNLTERALVRRAFEALNETVGHDDKGKPITRNEAFFAQHDRFPTDDEIAEFLEHQLAEEAAETLSARRARLANAATKASEAGTMGETRAAPQDSRGQSPRTLTARAAATRPTPKKEMTQEEMDEESLKILRAAVRKAG